MIERIPFLGFSEPISSLTHLISALIFLYFGSKMIWQGRGNAVRVISLLLYIGCAVFLFSMSGVYHLLEKGTTSNYVLQVLDHAGIYLMISGSFTPFQVVLLRGYKRWIPLTCIWLLGITGLTLTSIFFSTMPEWLLLSFFISMGWMSVFTVWFIRKVDFKSVKYLFIGGLLYTTGAIFDFARWPSLIHSVFEAHEIFHIFVTAGALVHFKAIYRLSTIPVSDQLDVYIRVLPNIYKAHFSTEHGQLEAQSDEGMRLKIKAWIETNYLKALTPKNVRLKYFKEDKLD